MILKEAISFAETDIGRFAWTNLRSFDHVESTTDKIMKAHSLARKWKENARKQAYGIRNCLVQAREYAEAYKNASLATKPLLLYYSVMSLALAQVLFKGTGDQSLDRARKQNAHHGLLFTLSPFKSKSYDISETAASLRAKPMEIDGRRMGTFELWHELSRGDPLIGPFIRTQNFGTVENDAQVLFFAEDKRPDHLPKKGVSFWDCIQSMPCMVEWLGNRDMTSRVVRAAAEARQNDDDVYKMTLNIHPHESPAHIESFQNEIKFRTSSIEFVDVRQFNDCFSLYINHHTSFKPELIMPAGSMHNNKEIRFLHSDIKLNEFGIFYVALFMLGNLARYFPDVWMKEVESYSPLASAADYFLEKAEGRVGLLTLSDLSETYFVPLA